MAFNQQIHVQDLLSEPSTEQKQETSTEQKQEPSIEQKTSIDITNELNKRMAQDVLFSTSNTPDRLELYKKTINKNQNLSGSALLTHMTNQSQYCLYGIQGSIYITTNTSSLLTKNKNSLEFIKKMNLP